MKTAIHILCALCLLFLVYAAAHATSFTARDDAGNVLRITDAPCVEQSVLQHAPPQVHAQLRAAYLHYQGKDYKACWMPLDAQSIIVVDEAGDSGAVPLRAMVPDVEATK